jgi:Icc protein
MGRVQAFAGEALPVRAPTIDSGPLSTPPRSSAMNNPFLLAQLTDPHIGATWGPGDPVGGLRAVIASILRLRPGVDAVLISGDLADHASDSEYEQLAALVADLEVPVYVLAGNHDDRDALRRHFDLTGELGTPLQYAVDLGSMRLIALDTTRPGHDGGELNQERLAWLDAELAAVPDKPTLLAMHHPPLATGIPAFDEIGLPVADQRALGEVVQRHPQALRLIAGHVHRTIVGALAGRPVLSLASTFAQARLSIGAERFEFVAEPAGFAVHALLDGELSSHVQPVA